MNGDLLRTLEGPERLQGPESCLRPKLIQASREGHCVIYYENGLFCVFSVNGRLQATMEIDDKIRVSVPQMCASSQLHGEKLSTLELCGDSLYSQTINMWYQTIAEQHS